ncbi:H+/Cl- antiporter ClcA [Lactobacillus colini]|uniref:H+/Cl- antiporter ClcA n=1 Tax=Lactobacillus colini TaxID=1819254 RepID=A0ABS4MG64_9LACO|nr:ClC family H(+)/Cl(-) exchange transporter [Lactobacillus colini]MBP2058686.1 H+/Cl- antiporter ClcA [Lactobacillus colini]
MPSAKKLLDQPFSSNTFKLIWQASIIGLTIGIVVSIFRLLIDHSISLLYILYPYLRHHLILLIPYIISILLVVFLLGKIIKYNPKNLSGSGIPQLQAMLTKQNQMPWFQILWRKFIGCLLAMAPGLFLGREGPCIQMGAMIAQGYSQNLYRASDNDAATLIYAGIAAGLSAAVSAPLAGVFFLFEEITHSFKSKIITAALAAATCSDLVTILFFGTKPCLYLPITHNLPVTSYWSLILVGMAAGILAYVYQWSLLNSRWLFSKLKVIPTIYHSIIPMVLIIPIGLIYPHSLGGSHMLIDIIFHNPKIVQVEELGNLTWLLIPIIFAIIRFIFSMLSSTSSVPGGIFMPTMVLGALLGLIAATILIHLGLIPPNTYTNIIVVSMTAYLAACLHAPITAIILLTEMIGTVEQVLPMIITVFIAYIVLSTLGGKPLYTAIRKQMNFK